MAGNPKCWHYDPIEPKNQANCLGCYHWGGSKCKDEALLLRREQEDTREIESIMRHDAYRRDHGGIRQVRRGT